jgi:hypothetical protein
MTQEDAQRVSRAIEDFVTLQVKAQDTGLTLDSQTYVSVTDSGQMVTGTPHWGVELLQGGAMAFNEVGAAIERTNTEMARTLGVEHLLLSDKGGSRALSTDKSQNFYLMVNGALDEIADCMNKDVVKVICDLNGIKDELRPKLKHSEVSFRSVTEVAAALAQMAQAGAILSPNDPAIDDVRDLLGLPHAPEYDEATGMMLDANVSDTEESAMTARVVPGNPQPGKPVPGTGRPMARPMPDQAAMPAGPGPTNKALTKRVDEIVLKSDSGDVYVLEVEDAGA